jgi:hypothetical protein
MTSVGQGMPNFEVKTWHMAKANCYKYFFASLRPSVKSSPHSLTVSQSNNLSANDN